MVSYDPVPVNLKQKKVKIQTVKQRVLIQRWNLHKIQSYLNSYVLSEQGQARNKFKLTGQMANKLREDDRNVISFPNKLT